MVTKSTGSPGLDLGTEKNISGKKCQNQNKACSLVNSIVLKLISEF